MSRHIRSLRLGSGGNRGRDLLQRGLTAERRRKVPPILRAGLRGLAAGKRIENRFEGFRREILVGVLADQHHRSVDACAQAFDLLPGEIPIGGDMERLVVNPVLAHLFERLATPQQAWRGTTPLHVGLTADRLQQEHRIESRHLQNTDMRHAEEVGHVFDRLARGPPSHLFLGAPQQRDDRRGLAALGIFGDLLFCPGKILRRKGEAFGLLFGGREAADGHGSPVRSGNGEKHGHRPRSALPTNDGPSSAATATVIPGGSSVIAPS